MLMHFNDEQPIYQQIARGIEDAILAGAFAEESQVPSTTELSVTYKINPATALKGVNMLVENGILYKKRGLGMFVRAGAVAQLSTQRREQFYQQFILPLVAEARALHIAPADIAKMIERGYDHEQHD
nr:GntR family transcriptional regulator [Maliibacterium massiliense]